MDLTLIPDLAIALGLGLLVGIERQRHAGSVAGIRTFAMITLLGALAAALGTVAGNVVVAVGLGAVAALLITGNLLMLRSDTQDPGMTTEVAALVMFAVGAMTVAGYRIQAFVVAGSVALLLHWKRPLHGLVRALGEADFHAVMRLVLIGLVILPMLPDRAWGPYDVLNPFRIWMMVVLIVGISLAAWVAMRLFGARAGTIAAGALGGLISSTAATVGYARRARAGAGTGPIALMIMLASTVAGEAPASAIIRDLLKHDELIALPAAAPTPISPIVQAPKVSDEERAALKAKRKEMRQKKQDEARRRREQSAQARKR